VRDFGVRDAALGIVPLLALVVFLAMPPAHALLTNDTPGYLYFTAGRPVLYPAFLWLVHALTGGYGVVRAVQAALYCGAVCWLGVAARGWAGGAPAAIVLQAIVLGYPAPLGQADQIQSDSLSATIIVVFAAQILRLATRPSPALVPGACGAAAVGVMTRPDNLALFPPLAVLIFCRPARAGRWRGAAWAASCLALALAATPLAHRVLGDGADRGQPLARGMIQKVLFLPPSPAGARDVCDADFIDSAAAGMVAYWRAAPPEYQDVLRLRISNLLRYSVIIPGLAARRGVASTAAVEPVLACYTRARAWAMPWRTAAGVVHEYADLVSNYTSVDAAWRRGYGAYLQSHPAPMPALLPLPPVDLALWRRAAADLGAQQAAAAAADDGKTQMLAPPAARGVISIYAIKSVQCAGAAVAWLFMLGTATNLLRRRPVTPVLLAGAAAGTALQLHLLAVAALEIAQPRYLYPVWPLIVTVLFLACQYIIAPRAAGARAPRAAGHRPVGP
jgi:hypothetical protein